MGSRLDDRQHEASLRIHTSPDSSPGLSQTLRAGTNDSSLKQDVKASTEFNVLELSSRQLSPPLQCSESTFQRAKHVLFKFGTFAGPGAIISVAYIDPDNYQTAISAGAEFKYKLLFMILL